MPNEIQSYSLAGKVRCLLAIFTLVPALIYVAAWFYGFFARGEEGVEGFIGYSVAYGILLYLIIKLGGCRFISLKFWLPLLLVAGISPILLGHYYAYQDTKDAVWRYVTENSDSYFIKDTRNFSRDGAFAYYVSDYLGEEASGFLGYLKFNAKVGWTGFEPTPFVKLGKTKVERNGIWVWLMWAKHFIIMLVVMMMVGGATMPDVPRKPWKKPESKRPKPERKKELPPPALIRSKAELVNEGMDGLPSDWQVVLDYKGRTWGFPYKSFGRPKTRDITASIERECYEVFRFDTFEAWCKAQGDNCNIYNEQARELFERLKQTEREFIRLLGSRNLYKQFINDDERFRRGMVEE